MTNKRKSDLIPGEERKTEKNKSKTKKKDG